jgi:hypothetical protein
MKPIEEMSQLELAAYVHARLRQEGIDLQEFEEFRKKLAGAG